MIHVSCGISILVLMVVRLLLRLKYPTPPIIPKPKPMMTGLAHLGHLVIYLLFIALPVIGLVMMYNRGNPWFAFGLTMPYASEANFERVDSLKSWHETLANLGYFVIGLHAAAALAHQFFCMQNTLLRFRPLNLSLCIFKQHACTKTDPWYRRRIRVYIGSAYYIYLYDK